MGIDKEPANMNKGTHNLEDRATEKGWIFFGGLAIGIAVICLIVPIRDDEKKAKKNE